MNKLLISIVLFSLVELAFISCNEQKPEETTTVTKEKETSMKGMKMPDDKRISLELNGMQKNHQLMNMRSHLEAIQKILGLIASDNYDEASEIAYTKLGSTTEMRMMCASFGNKEFENLGLEFHKSADELSEVLTLKDKDKSLEAIANTMNYCVNCHATFRQ